MVSIAVINHDKNSLERKGFISTRDSQVTLQYPGEPGQEPMAGRGAEAMEEGCLLACSCDFLRLPSHGIPDHYPKSGTAHSGSSISKSPIEKISHRFAHHQSGGGTFSIKVPFFKCTSLQVTASAGEENTFNSLFQSIKMCCVWRSALRTLSILPRYCSYCTWEHSQYV